MVERPPEEELNATVNGLTFEQFKVLSDEEVQAAWDSYRQEFDEVNIGWPSEGETETPEAQAFFAAWDKGSVLKNFMRWRIWGVPDRDMTHDEVMEYLGETVEAMRARDPEFGAEPAGYKDLEDDEKRAVMFLFEYFDDHRAPYEPIGVDEYSLLQSLGFKEENVQALIDKGILEPTGSYTGLDLMEYKTYGLAQQYATCWMARYFPPETKSAQ